jgi:hypothetical protein
LTAWSKCTWEADKAQVTRSKWKKPNEDEIEEEIERQKEKKAEKKEKEKEIIFKGKTSTTRAPKSENLFKGTHISRSSHPSPIWSSPSWMHPTRTNSRTSFKRGEEVSPPM